MARVLNFSAFLKSFILTAPMSRPEQALLFPLFVFKGAKFLIADESRVAQLPFVNFLHGSLFL
jgi:hypothetical protein